MTLSLLADESERPHRSARSALLGTFWLILAVALALAWLAFPYLLNGRRVLGDVGYSIQAERMNRSSATARLLVRAAYGRGEADVDVLYATTEYLDLIDPSGAARKYQPARYLVFLVTETTHVDQLPATPPHATLLVDGTCRDRRCKWSDGCAASPNVGYPLPADRCGRPISLDKVDQATRAPTRIGLGSWSSFGKKDHLGPADRVPAGHLYAGYVESRAGHVALCGLAVGGAHTLPAAACCRLFGSDGGNWRRKRRQTART